MWIIVTLANQRHHAQAANSKYAHEQPCHKLSTQTINTQGRNQKARQFYSTRYGHTDPDVWVEASEVEHQCVICET